MSTSAAIAAVTAVMKDVLLNGLVDRDAVSSVGNVMVTAQAPDRITVPEQNSQLNLFLYLVTPNAGWRNAALPARDAAGALVSAPPLAVDLHYLLSAYGTKDFHAEILLGYAMQLFHEMPVLTRDAIRRAFAPELVVNGDAGADGKIPAELLDLFRSGLADQIEQIKITPTYLNTEEMFKLWMAFQAPYRPTAAYHVSVVLIDGRRPGTPAPPVRRPALVAAPMARPAIVEICSQSAPGEPFLPRQPIRATDRLALLGTHLAGPRTHVRIGDQIVEQAGLDIQRNRIELTIPPAVAAGPQSVQVLHLVDLGVPPVPHPSIESNVVALVVCPVLSNVQAKTTEGLGGPADGPREGRVTLNIAPSVGKGQRVFLLLSEPAGQRGHRFECTSHREADAPSQSPSLTIPFTGVLPGTYLVQIQVDGAESPLTLPPGGGVAEPHVEIT